MYDNTFPGRDRDGPVRQSYPSFALAFVSKGFVSTRITHNGMEWLFQTKYQNVMETSSSGHLQKCNRNDLRI